MRRKLPASYHRPFAGNETTGELVSRERFLDAVWGLAGFPPTRTVDNHIANLRANIEQSRRTALDQDRAWGGIPARNKMNIQHPTSNNQHSIERRATSGNWMFDVGRWLLDVFAFLRPADFTKV
ncbi:MAG: winged helix-turn-helix domain-containing protein [Verrucomicrobia bacterium]|nr:winged helix-turn-helix domain-containing protein [Verrucomicrobiota bacterium]